jgi:ammonia channel protein AmtB
VIIKIVGLICGLRVTAEEENQGIDQAEHGEAAYND